MLKSELSIIDELIRRGLERIEIERLLSPMKVNPRQDVSTQSSLLDRISLKKSMPTEVPAYVAQILFEEGLADPMEVFLDLKSLARMGSEERYNEYRLTTLVPSFYFQLKRMLSSYRSQADDRKASQAESLATEILDLRLKKMLRFCLLSSTPPEIKRSMTAEEIHLLELLRHILSCWKKQVMGLGGK